jgi:hypothetical protein
MEESTRAGNTSTLAKPGLVLPESHRTMLFLSAWIDALIIAFDRLVVGRNTSFFLSFLIVCFVICIDATPWKYSEGTAVVPETRREPNL